jgi:hypothetical protein
MSNADNRFLLLDVIAEIGENKRLLIFGPLVVAAIIFGASFLLPSYYRSEAYLKLGEIAAREAEARIRSPEVLDVVLRKNRFPEDQLPKLRDDLDARISIGPPPKEVRKTATTAILEVKATTPLEAQATNKAIIDAWLDSTKPRPDAQVVLKSRLERAEHQFQSLSSSIDRLGSEASSLLSPSSMQGELATPLSNLNSQRTAIAGLIEDLQRQLAGESRDVIVAAPSLPLDPSYPPRLLMSTLGGVASWFGFLTFILVRGGVRRVAQDEMGAAKLARVREAWFGNLVDRR